MLLVARTAITAWWSIITVMRGPELRKERKHGDWHKIKEKLQV